MNHTALKTLIVVSLAACATHADILTHKNGDREEGFIITNDTTLRWESRDRVQSFELALSQVSNIEFGVWISSAPTGKEELEPSISTDQSNIAAQVAASNMSPHVAQMQKLMPGIERVTPGKVFTMQNISVVAWFVGMVILSIVSFVMAIVLIIDAFKNSMLWGFLCLCCGPAQLIYLFTQYSGSKGKMAFWLFFPAIWAIIGQLFILKPFLAKLAP